MTEAMLRPITNVHSLAEAMALLDRLEEDSAAFEGRFEPLESRYAALARFEVYANFDICFRYDARVHVHSLYVQLLQRLACDIAAFKCCLV